MKYLGLIKELNKSASFWAISDNPIEADSSAERVIIHTANAFYKGSSRFIELSKKYYNFSKKYYSCKNRLERLLNKT